MRLNNALIIKYTSYEKGEQFKEDLVTDICSWEGFNTNDDTTNWRHYSPRQGIIILGCNAVPEVDWDKFFNAYNELTRLEIYHSDNYSFESFPHYCEQDYSEPCMEIYRNFKAQTDIIWTQLCCFNK